MGAPLKDISGQQFGDRVAVQYVGMKKWLSRCRCGAEVIVDGADLRRRAYKCNHLLLDRFWSKVRKTNDCWIWTGAKQSDGYGSFRAGTKTVTAHSFAWELEHGEAPIGKELDHLCRNRACVNPMHLEPVSHAENVRRGALGATTKQRFAKQRLRSKDQL